MKALLMVLLFSFSLTYADELSAGDLEIIKELEFFSNMELLEEEISLEELESFNDTSKVLSDRSKK